MSAPSIAKPFRAGPAAARTIRVLRVVTRLNIGGPAHHVSLLSGRLGAPYDTLLVAGRLGRGEAVAETDPGVRIEIVDRLGRDPHPSDDLQAVAQLIRIIRRFRPDIVHTHTAKAGFLGRVAAAVAVRPRPIVVHTYEGHVLNGYFGPAKSAAYGALERFAARTSDVLVGVSLATVAELVDLGVAPRSKFRVIPLGLDLGPFLELDAEVGAGFRDEAGAGAGDVLVTFVGRLVPIKRVDIALRAVSEARAYGAPIRFAIVGDGEQRGELESLAASLGLGDSVRFFGYRRDTPAIAAATDVAILTSDREALGASLIEAAAAGRPAVASAVGGIPEVVAPGCGITAGRGDVGEIAGALERLAGDPALRRTMGERARAHVTARFSVDRLLRDVDDLYRELLGRRARAAA